MRMYESIFELRDARASRTGRGQRISTSHPGHSAGSGPGALERLRALVARLTGLARRTAGA